MVIGAASEMEHVITFQFGVKGDGGCDQSPFASAVADTDFSSGRHIARRSNRPRKNDAGVELRGNNDAIGRGIDEDGARCAFHRAVLVRGRLASIENGRGSRTRVIPI